MRPLAVTIALIATALASPSLSAQRKECKETRHPKQLPPVSALIDSARALNMLATAGLLDTAGSMAFSLAFLEDDSMPRVRPLELSSFGGASAIAHAARPQNPGRVWGIRVRVAHGPAPALTLERSTYCPPELAEGALTRLRFSRFEVRPGDRPPSGRGGTRATIRLEAKISEDGVPIIVNLMQSSGFREVDAQFVDQWRTLRFQPALLDGLPIEGWYKTDGQSPRL
jgi:hypothetical protein